MKRTATAVALVALLAANAATATPPAEQARAATTIAPAVAASAGAATAITVRDPNELVAALDPQNAGRHISVLAGDYAITGPLVVPDGAQLEGGGVMRIVDGLPVGFEPGTETTLRVVSPFQGDLMTLGDGSSITGLTLIDVTAVPATASSRAGNVVMVGSRKRGDRVAAEIRDCEIVNPQPTGVANDGPTGHAIMILTRNPARQDSPPPHDGARLALHVARSIVRATGNGGAVFALNVATRGDIAVKFEHNRVEGAVSIAGGASRPDLVTEASTSFESNGNLYARYPTGRDEFGWRVIGGSSAHIPGLASPGASFNVVRVHSVDDRIEEFKVGILSAAGRRWLSASGPVSDNRVELDLTGTRLRTEGQNAVDFALQGALSEEAPGVGREFAAGDRNLVRVSMRGVTGSPAERANRYTNVYGPSRTSDQGTGNRLEFAGTAAEFAGANPSISVAPPAEFFEKVR